jgi:uncharacterized Zn finger protein
LIFHLRGLKKNELLEALNKERGVSGTDAQIEPEEIAEEEAVEPIACDPAIFWKINKDIDYHFSLKPPPINAAILHRLGVPQFWMGTEKDFYKVMEKVYKDVSNYAIKIAYASKEIEKELD